MAYQTIDRTQFLDDMYTKLQRPTTTEAIDELFTGLTDIRRSSAPADWIQFAQSDCRRHPVRHLIHEDPISRRSFQKPRGYAGDAVILDFLYDDPSVREELHTVSPLGQYLAQYQMAASTARAVRLRRDLLARIIDDVATTQASPDILSIACGHLREAKLTEAVQARRIGRFVALDHDPASLNVVATDLAPFGVEPVVGSVRTLLRGKPALGTFDLVYAAGLFDYLPLKVAQRLLGAMFCLLKPEGRLVVTNAVPDLPEIGFMESFMDWELIYRTVPELAAMAAALPISELADLRIYAEDQHAFLFLDIRRR